MKVWVLTESENINVLKREMEENRNEGFSPGFYLFNENPPVHKHATTKAECLITDICYCSKLLISLQ